MRKFWLKEEVKLLIKLYEKDGLSLSELYPIFSVIYERSYDSVSVKIGKLKLRHTKDQIKKLKSRLNSGQLNGMFGKASSIKGLTKENSEIIKNKSDKLSKTRKEMFKLGLLPPLTGETNPMYGSIAWNNGLTKHTDNRILNYCDKISVFRKKEWLLKTEEEKNKIIIRLNDAMIQVNKPTRIENKIESFLKEQDIEYIKNKRFKTFIFDFYLPKNHFVIECDGDYWHANPRIYLNKILTEAQLKNVDRDKRKDVLLNENNISFIRFWEYDIHNNFEEVKKIIWEKLQKK